MHAKWASYFEQFHFVICHKSGSYFEQINKFSDALSRSVSLLISLQSKIIGFKFLKVLYEEDENFAEIWRKCLSRHPAKDFHILDGFLLKESDYV